MEEGHLLELKNLGKIYTDGDEIAVGIRKINVSFDIGEFVVLVGESGSGKSTLLNVIGGLDSFEEGELFYSGKCISNFSEKQRDDYRNDNISFIFQEYNIVDSFTIRENVMIATYDCADNQTNISRCNEILRHVGLYRIADKKAGKLSGGQKQRVAIARALTEKRTVILADEPTSHLDAETAKEVVEILAEAAKDCLVIVSTHDTAVFSEYATRILTLKDGELIDDTQIRSKEKVLKNEKNDSIAEYKKASSFYAGIKLGMKMILAKRKMTFLLFFMFLLMLIFLFGFTSTFFMKLKEGIRDDDTMFRGGNNRVVIVKRDETPISRAEVNELEKKLKANRSLQCDILIDSGDEKEWYYFLKQPQSYSQGAYMTDWDTPYNILEAYSVGEPDIGRYPEKASECFLYVPCAFQDYYGTTTLKQRTERIFGVDYKIVGVKYYVENDVQGKCFLSADGYQLASLMAYVGNKTHCEYKIIDGQDAEISRKNDIKIKYDFEVDETKVFVKSDDEQVLANAKMTELVFYYLSEEDSKTSTRKDQYYSANEKDIICNSEETAYYEVGTVLINPLFLMDWFNEFTNDNYRQCSLFFDNVADSKNAVNYLNHEGYIAVLGNTKTIELDSQESGNRLGYILGIYIAETIIVIVLGLSIYLFITRFMKAYRHDVTVMRAIGVKRNIVRMAIYYRIFVPFFSAMLIAGFGYCLALRVPFLNRNLLWLRIYDYIWIISVMLLIIESAVEKNRRMYLEVSVKNALIGGSEND